LKEHEVLKKRELGDEGQVCLRPCFNYAFGSVVQGTGRIFSLESCRRKNLHPSPDKASARRISTTLGHWLLQKIFLRHVFPFDRGRAIMVLL